MGLDDSLHGRVVDLGHVFHIVREASGDGTLERPRIVVPDRNRHEARRQLLDLAHAALDLLDPCDQAPAVHDEGVVDDAERAVGRDALRDALDGIGFERRVEGDDAEVQEQIELVAELHGQVEIAERAVDGLGVVHQAVRALLRSE
jgi:hypothetical protein